MAFIDCEAHSDSNITVSLLQKYGYEDAENIHHIITNGGHLDCGKMKWFMERNLRAAIKNNDASYLDPDREKKNKEFMEEFEKQPKNGLPLTVGFEKFAEERDADEGSGCIACGMG